MLFEACSHTFRCAAVKLFEHTCLVGKAFFFATAGWTKVQRISERKIKKEVEKRIKYFLTRHKLGEVVNNSCLRFLTFDIVHLAVLLVSEVHSY